MQDVATVTDMAYIKIRRLFVIWRYSESRNRKGTRNRPKMQLLLSRRNGWLFTSENVRPLESVHKEFPPQLFFELSFQKPMLTSGVHKTHLHPALHLNERSQLSQRTRQKIWNA